MLNVDTYSKNQMLGKFNFFEENLNLRLLKPKYEMRRNGKLWKGHFLARFKTFLMT